MNTCHAFPHRPGRHRFAKAARQRGIALIIVVVLVLVSALLTLWGFRTASLNEAVVGNDADYLRAFEAAQALVQDAELDISGRRPDGSGCISGPTDGNLCRRTTGTWFIDEQQLMGTLVNQLSAFPTRCQHGICLKRTGIQDFWNDQSTLTAMIANGVAARYGQYTGAATGSASNPILANQSSGEGGWYWVEILPYESEGVGGGLVSGGGNKLALHLSPSLVYRITALARGRKAGTQVVLQSTYVQQKTAD